MTMYDGFDDENDLDVDDDVVDDIHLWSLHQDTSGAGRPPSTAQVNDNSWVTTWLSWSMSNIMIMIIPPSHDNIIINIIIMIMIIDRYNTTWPRV